MPAPEDRRVRRVTAVEARTLIAGGARLVDVREEDEWRDARIPGATLIPLSSFAHRWREIPPAGTIILQCQSGTRSQQAAEYLLAQGREDVVSLTGGISAWARVRFPVEVSP